MEGADTAVFACFNCNLNLTGYRYILRDEKPFCIKCYESLFANACEDCKTPIGTDSKVIVIIISYEKLCGRRKTRPCRTCFDVINNALQEHSQDAFLSLARTVWICFTVARWRRYDSTFLRRRWLQILSVCLSVCPLSFLSVLRKNACLCSRMRNSCSVEKW